jgi:hypothetical protein
VPSRRHRGIEARQSHLVAAAEVHEQRHCEESRAALPLRERERRPGRPAPDDTDPAAEGDHVAIATVTPRIMSPPARRRAIRQPSRSGCPARRRPR